MKLEELTSEMRPAAGERRRTPWAICFGKLSIPKSSLDNWVRASRKGQLADVGKGQRLPTELELELSRTRKELADVKMERDLLKKFATYFAKESR
jgi:transposase